MPQNGLYVYAPTKSPPFHQSRTQHFLSVSFDPLMAFFWPLKTKLMITSNPSFSSLKGGLISESFFHLQRNVPNYYPEHFVYKKKLLGIVIWQIFFRMETKVKVFLRLRLLLKFKAYFHSHCIKTDGNLNSSLSFFMDNLPSFFRPYDRYQNMLWLFVTFIKNLK